MAKLKLSADLLLELLMQRPNFVTLNSVTMDPVYRTVILDITGSDVPDAEEVTIEAASVQSRLIPVVP